MTRYSPHTQLAILNYIRFRSGDYQREMYEIMMDKKAHKELRLAAIRYCGKYPYEPAYGPLLAFVEDKDAPNGSLPQWRHLLWRLMKEKQWLER